MAEADHLAMNTEDGDADHVAVHQSDQTRTTSAAQQAAAVRVSAGQKPPSGGSAEVPDGVLQHHQEHVRFEDIAGAGPGPETSSSSISTPTRTIPLPAPQNVVQASPSSDAYESPGGELQSMSRNVELDDRRHDRRHESTLELPLHASPRSLSAAAEAPDGSAASRRPLPNDMGSGTRMEAAGTSGRL